jgi:hypothetical protein
MTTEINNVEPTRSRNKYTDLRSLKAMKIQELSELLDELFSLKAKLQKTEGGDNDGKR